MNEKISECKRLRTNCSWPEACPRVVFRNNHKIQFHWPNNHNEPTDGVKLGLMDKYMIKMACIIKNYQPKTAELLRLKALLTGKKVYNIGGGLPAKNVTYTITRGKRSTQVSGGAGKEEYNNKKKQRTTKRP